MIQGTIKNIRESIAYKEVFLIWRSLSNTQEPLEYKVVLSNLEESFYYRGVSRI